MVTDAEKVQKAIAQPMVGTFFHSKTEDGALNWQGLIITDLGDGLYRVQLYGWLWGDPTLQKLVKLSDMLDWDFYRDRESWVDAGGEYQTRLADDLALKHRQKREATAIHPLFQQGP